MTPNLIVEQFRGHMPFTGANGSDQSGLRTGPPEGLRRELEEVLKWLEVAHKTPT